jgi:hypothetical protein
LNNKKYQWFNEWSSSLPVEWKYGHGYEILVDMEKKEVVCVLTEPEDRTFGRDLSPIVDILNSSQDTK